LRHRLTTGIVPRMQAWRVDVVVRPDQQDPMGG
jgi:hypothetical protein